MVSDQFYGTLANTSGYYCGKRDHVDVYIPERSQELVVTYVRKQRRTTTVFERDRVASANPYGVFFGGNYGLMRLDTAQSGKRLFVIKDSYAGCFLPFLVPYHKSITAADPRYYYNDPGELIEEQGVQETLLLYNANTLFSDNSLNEILKKEMK